MSNLITKVRTTFGFFIVPQNSTAVTQLLGKHFRVKGPGLRWTCPVLTKAQIVSNREITTKIDFRVITANGVNCQIEATMNTHIPPKNSADYVYRADDPDGYMLAKATSIAREQCGAMDITQILAKTDLLSSTVRDKVTSNLSALGVNLTNFAITCVEPDKGVKDAMNESFKAEKFKEATLREAEAVSQAMILKAKAKAQEREIMATAFANSRLDLVRKLNISPQEITEFLLEQARIEAQQNIAKSDNTKVIIMEQGKNKINEMIKMQQLIENLIRSNEIKKTRIQEERGDEFGETVINDDKLPWEEK